MIRRAGEILETVLGQWPDSACFIKMDGEGCEVEIFEDALFLDQLDRIAGMVIETHTPSIFKQIRGLLEERGFAVAGGMVSHSNGYLRATRRVPA